MIDQTEIEKLAEIQRDLIQPVVDNGNDADVVIKIRNGKIVHCELRGIKLRRMTFKIGS